jgi:integrase
MRVSELCGLACQDVRLGSGAHIRCTGKGRKQRSTPLTRSTAKVVAARMRERAGQPGDPLFPPAAAGRSAGTPSRCSPAVAVQTLGNRRVVIYVAAGITKTIRAGVPEHGPRTWVRRGRAATGIPCQMGQVDR